MSAKICCFTFPASLQIVKINYLLKATFLTLWNAENFHQTTKTYNKNDFCACTRKWVNWFDCLCLTPVEWRLFLAHTAMLFGRNIVVITVFMISIGEYQMRSQMFGILLQVIYKRENVTYRFKIFVIPFKGNLRVYSHKTTSNWQFPLFIKTINTNDEHCIWSGRLNWVSYINNRCFQKLMIVIFLSVLKLNITLCQVWIMCQKMFWKKTHNKWTSLELIYLIV